MIEHATPHSYAAHLSNYIADPSTIRVRTLEVFGKAPSVDQCRNMRRSREQLIAPPAYGKNVRFRPLFRCGHPETDENSVLCRDGIDRCKTCIGARKADAERIEQTRQAKLRAHLARERADKEALTHKIEDVIAKIVTQRPAERARISSDTIGAVARHFGFTPDDIKGRDKHDAFVDARCAVALLMRERGLSYPQIGRFLNRDHSTIINLIAKAPRRCARNPMILQAVAALR